MMEINKREKCSDDYIFMSIQHDEIVVVILCLRQLYLG